MRAGCSAAELAPSPGRINHLLAAVRECYKHPVVNGAPEPSVLVFPYEADTYRHLPTELRPEGSAPRTPQNVLR